MYLDIRMFNCTWTGARPFWPEPQLGSREAELACLRRCSRKVGCCWKEYLSLFAHGYAWLGFEKI
eukprot:774616-Amorphochlora_amoeboformis.AAC.2